MRLKHDLLIVYPDFAPLIRAIPTVTLSARSLIIKACQAQLWPVDPSSSTLATLLSKHPDVLIYKHGDLIAVPLRNFIPYFEIDLQDPLTSAIVLDICRASPLSNYEKDKAREDSWVKEITLAQGYRSPQMDKVFWPAIFNPAFHQYPLFRTADPNPNMSRHIHSLLSRFRQQIRGRRYYPRATHKNMSRATRRHYEELHGSIEDVPIFGQDNWQYIYHTEGIFLEGCCEMRQKWYPSGAKPRTYFAMGGTAYRHCRHLQGFFTDLVNLFAPTNHISRLQPDRLTLDPLSRSGHNHFRIYDMSNFTSNMDEQKRFMDELTGFFMGVEIEVVDERDGLICVDIGDLLVQYQEHCVDGPLLSIERYDANYPEAFPHGIASLLGIFGNLMSCTVAHFLIMTPIINNFEEINIAGDDGVVPEDEFDTLSVQDCWDHVGVCARDKTFRGDEEGAICLKRPFVENLPHAVVAFNIIPPSVAVASAYLSGISDSRYTFQGLGGSKNSRLSVVGKDLLRFLRSAYQRGFDDEDRLFSVVEGFRRLATHYLKIRPEGSLPGPEGGYTWPLNPRSYDFLSFPPLHMLVLYRSSTFMTVRKMETRAEMMNGDEPVGFEYDGNMGEKMRLLVRFGYVDATVIEETVDEAGVQRFWSIVLNKAAFVPLVYHFVVLKEVPVAFWSW